MSDKTYFEMNKNDKATIQLTLHRKDTGTPFYPSGAYYQVLGRRKDNILIPKTSTRYYQNQIWTTITQSITSSAAEYDIHWEIHSFGGEITNHCTKLLIVDC